MWISQAIQKENSTITFDVATVSRIENGCIQAIGNNKYDNISMASPIGFSAIPSVGDMILVLSCSQGDICLGGMATGGTAMQGEIKLSAPGGAYLHLKSNGDIVLNGITIHANGTIEGGTMI